MRGFVKSIILIIIFFALITLSFIWFNRDKKNITNVPYVEEFFERVETFSSFIDSVSIKFFSFTDKKNREDK